MRNWIKFLLLGISTAGILLALFWVRNAAAAVVLLQQAEYDALIHTQTKISQPAHAGTLRIMGEDAPFDKASETYYVPQSMEKAEWDWPLSWSNPTYTAHLCPDGMLSDKAGAIAQGHAFSLLITDGK